MKNNNKYILFIFSLLTLIGCKKSFLEINPEQNIDQEKAVVDIASTRAAVMGLYSFLQNTDYYGRTALLLPDLMTDNVVQSRQAGQRYNTYQLRTFNSGDGYAGDLWKISYRIIVNANTVINKAPSIKVSRADSTEMRQLVGEAYALRALAYFDLARFFCSSFNTTTDSSHLGVPIVLNSYPNGVNNITNPPRNTIGETYGRIIADLNSALTFLPINNEVYFNGTINSESFKVRLNRLGVFAITARAQLYKENWAAAEAAASVVINSGRFSLFGANMVNDFKVPQNVESIFEIANNAFDNAGSDGLAYIYNQGGFGEMLGTQNLFDGYNSTDTRRGFMTIGNRASAGGETNIPLVNKYSNINTYLENLKLFRYAEMFLIRSEARARINTPVSFPLAQADLQTIVTARNSSTLSVVSSNTTAASVITRIMTERRREFAFEGHRLFDFTRTKSGFNKYRIDGTIISVSATSFRNILPIPISETRANPNLIQNPSF